MESEIKKLLGVQKQSGARGRNCPDETQLAAFLAKRLDRSAHAAVEFHLADCDFCLSQLAFLTQSDDAENLDQVPFPLLSRARGIVAKAPKPAVNWGWRWAAPLAAVVCLILLAVIVVLQLRRRETASLSGPLIAQQNQPLPINSPEIVSAPRAPLPSETGPLTAAPRTQPNRSAQVRSNSSEALIPKVLAPQEGASIRAKDLELRWQPVADALFYEVRLLSGPGDIVLSQQTENTSLKPGTGAALVPGTKYFVVVSAHLRQGKTQKSTVVSFRLSGQ
jgi:hypothetical protein